jgi:AraC-like DNA-binding protein
LHRLLLAEKKFSRMAVVGDIVNELRHEGFFDNSLRLVTKREISLTSIAYDCGYFDQSHFIKEFKSFTGLTPSGYSSATSPVALALAIIELFRFLQSCVSGRIYFCC